MREWITDLDHLEFEDGTGFGDFDGSFDWSILDKYTNNDNKDLIKSYIQQLQGICKCHWLDNKAFVVADFDLESCIVNVSYLRHVAVCIFLCVCIIVYVRHIVAICVFMFLYLFFLFFCFLFVWRNCATCFNPKKTHTQRNAKTKHTHEQNKRITVNTA